MGFVSHRTLDIYDGSTTRFDTSDTLIGTGGAGSAATLPTTSTGLSAPLAASESSASAASSCARLRFAPRAVDQVDVLGLPSLVARAALLRRRAHDQ
eukprot:6023573-Prymnesium_polylepis.1